jgi:beta-xylosidase
LLRRRSRVVVIVSAALLAVACVPLAPPAPPAYGPNPPVHATDFPDPMVANVDAAFEALSTNRGLQRVPTATSADLRQWTDGADALTEDPAWVSGSFGYFWAPAAHQFGAAWVLYFTARHPTGSQCIGLATATTAAGPFDPDDEPLVCQLSGGGSIDPSVTIDANGIPWLLWKNDGNCCELPVNLYSQQLAPDGLSLVGSPTAILGVSQGWEDGSSGGQHPWRRLIEAPAMVFADGTYWLFYSGNWWDGVNYAVGYARCTSPAGGCTKPRDGPILKGSLQGAGPGGAEVVAGASGQRWLVYHAWAFSNVGYSNGGSRTMRLSALTFANGEPVLGAGP